MVGEIVTSFTNADEQINHHKGWPVFFTLEANLDYNHLAGSRPH